MQAFGAAIAGLDVLVRFAGKDPKASGWSGNVRAKCRAAQPLAIQAVADRNRIRFDVCLISNRTTVALAFNSHRLSNLPNASDTSFSLLASVAQVTREK
jgi:hypothetical protein